jgi:hypothetical protein
MSQLAHNVSLMLGHSTLLKSLNIIQIRGRTECVESTHIKYIYKSGTACISTDSKTFEGVKRIMSNGTFFLYPTTLAAGSFMESMPYWTVLDLFWGYDIYSKDHGEQERDTGQYQYSNLAEFMKSDTRHDTELKNLVYGEGALLRDVADMAMRKLAEMARSNDLFDAVRGAQETVFMINRATSSSLSYTFDTFYGDKDTYAQEMKKFGLDVASR